MKFKRFFLRSLSCLCICFLMAFFLPSVAHADSGFTIEFAGTVNYGGVDTITDMTDLGSGRYAFTMADHQSFLLSDTYTFSAGYWYSGEFLFEIRTGIADSETSVVCTLSIGNYASILRATCTTDYTGYGVCHIPFDFCPDTSFDTNTISLELSMSGTPDYGLGTVRPCTVSVKTSDEHQTSAIGGFFDGLWKKLSGAFDKIGNWFSALGDRIQGFFTQLIEDIKGLFVPSDGYFDQKQQELQDAMEEHLGMVYQAGSLLDDLLESVTSGANKGTITFPEVKWDDQILISTQEVRIIPEGFEWLQVICKTVTSLVLCLAFLNMLRIKFEQFTGGGSGDR